MKIPVPELVVFTFNNRADALALANDCSDDCVVVACVNNRTTIHSGRKGVIPTVVFDHADVPCCWMVVNNLLLAELTGEFIKLENAS